MIQFQNRVIEVLDTIEVLNSETEVNIVDMYVADELFSIETTHKEALDIVLVAPNYATLNISVREDVMHEYDTDNQIRQLILDIIRMLDVRESFMSNASVDLGETEANKLDESLIKEDEEYFEKVRSYLEEIVYN